MQNTLYNVKYVHVIDMDKQVSLCVHYVEEYSTTLYGQLVDTWPSHQRFLSTDYLRFQSYSRRPT